jgi:hypothetical protein
VVALREVDGMPHPAHLTLPRQFSWLAIPEGYHAPGEGTVFEIDEIFGETKWVF